MEALPRPETDVTDAQRAEGDALVKEATDHRDGVQAELQKAEGALQQVGSHAIQEKLEQADEAVQAIDRREHELDLDYGAWQLLRNTLQEAEAADAVHLGKALVEPITDRMAQLGYYPLDTTNQMAYYSCMKSGTPFLSIASTILSSSFFRRFPKINSATSASGRVSMSLGNVAFFLGWLIHGFDCLV